jgi:sporulation protein YlmC with PRC-barrel domain
VSNTTEIPTHTLHVGAAVYTANGEKVGKLRFVVVDPESEVVTHLVLERGMMLSRDVLAPIGVVGKVMHRGIFLTVSPEEVQELPDFAEGRYLSGNMGGGGGQGGGGGERKDRGRKRFRGGGGYRGHN